MESKIGIDRSGGEARRRRSARSKQQPRFFITLMNHSRRHLLSVIQSARQRRGPQSTLLASHSHSISRTARTSLVAVVVVPDVVGCQTMTVDQLRSTPTSPDVPLLF
ncbi:hypothetical protein ALC53_02276 [Atta colombica]|uniref:Uncharacterized protein n=1 Tax=Atta colombica TaxID=520822 RepID=A0A195BU71_9HYME|nr:hypothetical protein ALC53_02276 [Atta colombica]